MGGVIKDGREGARMLVPPHSPAAWASVSLFPGSQPPGSWGLEEQMRMRKAQPLSPLSIPSLWFLIRYPLPSLLTWLALPHIPLGFSGHQGPPPSFIAPPRPTGSAKGSMGLSSKAPQDRMLCTPGSIRKHPGPSDRDRDPGSVHCLRSHLVEMTWLFFYLLLIRLLHSFILWCIHSFSTSEAGACP